MKRKLYNMLVPSAIRDRLYNMHVQQFLDQEWKKKSEIEKTLPHTDLSSAYIKNLKVVTNRSELLGILPKNANIVVVGSESWDLINQVLILTQPNKVYVICTSPCSAIDVLQSQFRSEIQNRQVEFIVGEPDFNVEKLPDAWADWMYLDTNNLHVDLLALLEISQLKVVESGLITGNNYTTGDWITSQRFGVIEAINTFCKKCGWEMTYLTHESNRKLHYVLRRVSRYESA